MRAVGHLREFWRRLRVACAAFVHIMRHGDFVLGEAVRRIEGLRETETHTHAVRMLDEPNTPLIYSKGGEAVRRIEGLREAGARWEYLYDGALRDWGPRG